jgi:nitrile hydratase subunit beta
MNGVHDLGGMHGFGPINPEKNEPVFHAEWEKRILGLFVPVSAVGPFCVDEFRSAIEKMGAENYLATSYYEHWLHAFETIVVEKGVVTKEELTTGKSSTDRGASTPPIVAKDVPHIASHGSSARVDVETPPQFKVGDLVMVKNNHPENHTRCPRYARDKLGSIEKDYGVFVFPDTAAHGQGEKPQHCYSVRFDAQELWGDKASAKDAIYIDLWDDYLHLA